ncbi:SMP-30/gluconolactonase/LRE family protein [uncultured Martelella sp.]|uniref:SMP-30/gluconolactonase/LRE family protein n=1 Tax=uncultured Martelella sp. TaxID=392331 RepID=UPI0029C7246C|nr:SMP-30/gluconolactonase/LRE family protein [uncultured Martelella sp.]
MDNKDGTGTDDLPRDRKHAGKREATVPGGAAALAKGFTLLNLVADAKQPLRFSELHKQSGLSKPTFARILRTLVAFGLVRQDTSQGTYVLGARFMQLSQKVWETFDLSAFASPELRNLSSELGETVALCVLDGDEVHFMEQQAGTGLGVLIDPGWRAPVYSTAAGKALLAFQEPGVARALLHRLSFHAYTATTITTMEKLQAELTLTQARGYAISFEEHLPGVNSVAVTIAGRDGLPVGALTVLGPSSRLTETSMHVIGRELIAAARRITGAAGAVAISSHPRPRSTTGNASTPLECVLPWGAQLGEAPVWHPTEHVLYWVDILGPNVFRFDPVSRRNESRDIGKLVSSVLPAEDGKLLLTTQDGIEWFDFASGKLEPFVHPEAGVAENRLNDAKTGPDGAIWVGSMRIDASRPSGALYRVLADGRFETKETGITVSNGLGWSPDGRTLYFIDTVPGHIYAYDFEIGTGTASNRRIFVTVEDSEGRPDGLTVDAEGGVWVAIWDGWCVKRYRPDGRFDRAVELPVPRPTSLTFGGKDLDTLFITSARTRLPAATLTEAPLSGGLFACRTKEKGAPSPLFISKR